MLSKLDFKIQKVLIFEKRSVHQLDLNPDLVSCSGSSIQSCFKKHEAIKKGAYESRIHKVEHSTLQLGVAHEATIFYKRLSNLLSDKWKKPCASVLGWVRCCLSFCLLRLAIQCIRGARSSQGIKSAPVDLIQSET